MAHADPIRFPFRKGASEIYGAFYRPVAKVYVRTGRGTWLPHFMYIDSGADYSLLPQMIGQFLGLESRPGEREYEGKGVGGSVKVVMRRLRMRIGPHEFSADVGWARSDDVPLLRELPSPGKADGIYLARLTG